MAQATRYATSRLSLMTLTPVFVGAGKEATLSPYSDFVQEGRSLYYLDPDKLESIFLNAPALVEGFVRGVRDGMENTRSTFDLAAFLRDRAGVTDLSTVCRRQLRVSGSVQKNQIRQFIQDGGRPFIPGSTIKGAMRTAIFYSWLQRTPEGQALLVQIGSEIDRWWDQVKGAFEELERLEDEDDADVKEKRKSDFHRLDRMKLLRRELNSVRKKCGQDFGHILNESSLFGGLRSRTGPDMRRLRVSDCRPFELGDMKVAQVVRRKLRDGSLVSPQWSEVARRNTTTVFDLGVEQGAEQRYLSNLFAADLRELWSAVNGFSGAVLDHEIARFSALRQGFPEVAVRLENLRGTVARAEGKYAVMRLGMFKTYFDNSVGLAIFSRNMKQFEHYRKLLGLGMNPLKKRLARSGFPTTRSVTDPDVSVLGWVMVGTSLPDLEPIAEDGDTETSQASEMIAAGTSAPVQQTSPPVFTGRIAVDTRIPAEVVRFEGKTLTVRLHLPDPLEVRVAYAAGLPPGTWIEIVVRDPKTAPPTVAFLRKIG